MTWANVWNRCRIAAYMLVASMLSPPLAAQPAYRINGITAPQVQPDPLAGQLNSQLIQFLLRLEARSQRTSLNQAMEAGLLHNPRLAAASRSCVPSL